MSGSFLVVANPAIHGGKSQRIIADFKEFLEAQPVDFEIRTTTPQLNAKAVVSEYFNHDNLIIIGGDGTINEAVNGLNKRVPVGIIPAGTGNDFVKNIAIGSSQEEIFMTSIRGASKEIDLGICNDRIFLNGVGVGFDGQIVANMINKRLPLLTGQAAYYYHVLQILSTYQSKDFELLVDGNQSTKKLLLLTIANGTTFGGGFKLTPNADLSDGFLDVCEIGEINALRRFLNIHRLQAGTHGILNEVSHYQAKQVVLEKNPLLQGHIDGELLGQPPFTISVLPGALTIRVWD